jgi:hypothetical protein
MPISLEVEKQCFAFAAPWTIAIKYDDTAFYREGPERLKGDLTERSNGNTKVIPQATRAVDVVALKVPDRLLLLEAKDFRGHRVENKHRMSGEVILEAALKVRDTVTALVGAARQPVTEFSSEQMVSALGKGNDLIVVLWVEDDTLVDVPQAKRRLDTLSNMLKAKLAWLNAKVLVQSCQVPNRLNGLTVTDLRGAGQR